MLDARDQLGQGGFAAAVGAGDDDELSLVHIQVQPLDDLLLTLFLGNVKGQILYLKHMVFSSQNVITLSKPTFYTIFPTDSTIFRKFAGNFSKMRLRGKNGCGMI